MTEQFKFDFHKAWIVPWASSIATLAQELELDKSAAWCRVRTAMDRGYLKNLEDCRSRPARLVPEDPRPDDIEILA